jgi:murein DD-endopeptidase MepM/ murein hydrolase activator NlpD
MKGIFLALLCLGWLAPGSALAGSAEKHLAESLESEKRLLGAADDEARFQALLPFTREIVLAGVVAGSLDGAMAEAGVPSVVRLEARHALGAALDLDDPVLPGDRFQLRYEQAFTVHGDEVGVGRLSWIELRTRDKGTVGAHRFRSLAHGEGLWLTTGQAAEPAVMRLPLDTIAISSRFGLRTDPFEQLKPVAGRGPVVTHATGRAASVTVNVATKRGVLAGLSPTGTTSRAAGRASAVWYMHEGVDLVAPIGTPIYAAGDGVITGMGPNGGYGNWVRIEHPGNLSTIYGHLQSFAEVDVGRTVARGELIGFVGSTGRSTGAHLHFELLSNGKPVDPLGHAIFKPVRLDGRDLERFRREVSRVASQPKEGGKIR